MTNFKNRLPTTVVVEDQTFRDGIQREKKILSTEEKIAFIKALKGCGIKRFQVTAFVNPKKVPQMADAEEVIKALQDDKEVSLSGLVLNYKGLERALRTQLRHVEISISASNTHGMNNTGMTLQEAVGEFKKMVKKSVEEQLLVKTSVQCAFGCQHEGNIDQEVVMDIIKRGLDLGAHEISLADTPGLASPGVVEERVGKVLELVSPRPLFLHLHDPNGKAIENVKVAIRLGIFHFDATLGGTGGCPYIKEAPGNLSIESLLSYTQTLGISTNIELDRLQNVSRKLLESLRSGR